MTLYLFKVLNYYNRIVKRADNISDYTTRLGGSQLQMVEGVSFNPNDGISTKHIINYTAESMPDYLIAVDELNNINSRWYIIEAKRVRANQYEFTLYRDVIADWYDDVINAPAFIEKAMLSRNDPAIYNSENMTFNQIKTYESTLMDNTKSAWIVGYFNKGNIPLENRTINVPTADVVISGTYATREDFPYNVGITAYPNDVKFRIDIDYTGGAEFCVGWNTNGNLISPTIGVKPTSIVGISKPEDSAYNPNNAIANLYQKALNNETGINWDTSLVPYLNCATKALTNEYVSANGKIYKIGDKYYRFYAVIEEDTNRRTTVASSSGIGNDMLLIADRAGTNRQYIEGASIEWNKRVYRCLLFEYNVEAIDFVMTNDPVEAEDAPYNMFAIPYHSWLIDTDNGTTTDEEACRRIAEALQRQLGSYLIDMQILPYCPFPAAYRKPTGILDKDKIPSDGRTWYQDITVNNNKYVGTILYCPQMTFSFSIERSILVSLDPVEFKVENECNFYRLCSPNYNGQFEFSAAKNKGVDKWNVNCTYKPFQPYIHVAPNFDGLYGKDFDDARGLICGGDFAMPQISDKWVEYQIQNKNFQDIFNRQIENMEVQQKYERVGDIVNAVTGSLTGVGAGALAGSMVAPGLGTVVGAVGGGLASGIGGIMDVGIKEALRNEALDYTKDQFGFQLGNIRALPYSITKVSAINANNKYFPFIEAYTATDMEKQALRDKIKYNGMTVGRIGTIADFLQTNISYIKAKLIRLEGISDDYHVINTIAEELNKGVFI